MKKRLLEIILSACIVLSFAACGNETAVSDTAKYKQGNAEETYANATVIKLSGDTATIDGESIESFDYTWHCDPSVAHDEVKNAPAEYYTGTKPETDAAAYIDNELYYYPSLPEDGFKKVMYDGETEWAYYYTDGENNDYIFATLPNLGTSLPTDMMHTEEEAAENKVLHICDAGTYILEGQWDGQIFVDLGDKDETFTDENAKITVILNGVDINCTVAPGVIFYSAYECDNTWEDAETHTQNVNTENAGVNVIVADGSENYVSGTNVFRMLKTKYKDEESNQTIKLQKKQRKTDAAFYSYVSMNIYGDGEGTGKLSITSGFEGLDSELHMSVDNIELTINSQDDGINVNEDNVSVVTFFGGNITINAALGAEGDGVDSNGYIVVNGGTVSVNGVVTPDSALDSEDGIYYNGGEIVIDGVTQSYEIGSMFRETGNMGGFDGEMGNRPQMPNGEMPDGQMPNFDGQMPNFDGEMPEMPDGEMPEMPDGGQNGNTPPNGNGNKQTA